MDSGSAHDSGSGARKAMHAMLRRAHWLLILSALVCCQARAAEAGEWSERLYGYQPRNYGYAPSNYVFPRYGFVRGYVYVEGPPYGSPALGDPSRCPPGTVDAAIPPFEEVEPTPGTPTESSAPSNSEVVRPAGSPEKSIIKSSFLRFFDATPPKKQPGADSQ